MTAPRVRIAPSPTGPLHIGTARTALFNYLYARHTGGTFILRLEDTDQARGSIAYEKDILDGLHWLGLHWDEGPEVAGEAARGPFAPYRQMLRLPLYAAAAERLLAADMAYPCYCTPEELDADRKAQEAAKQPPRYVGRCAHLTAEERAAREAEGRPAAIRFRVGTGVVGFDDIVRGHVEIDVANLGGDFVIVRGDGIAALPLHGRRRRRGDGDQPRHPRRGPPLEHAEAHPAVPRARLPGPALRPPAAHPQPRPDEDEQAQEPDRGLGLHRRGLHPRGAGQLPRAPRLGDRHRGGGAVDRRDRRALRARPTSTRAAPSSIANGSSGSTASGSAGSSRTTSIDRLRPFVEADLAAGRIDWMPSDEELRALLPVITERLPTLGAIGDLVGFLWVDELTYDPRSLVPKRWDVATTREGLVAARAVDRRGRARSRSRPTSSSRRSAPWPRRVAGRPATCSWPSGSRSPAGPRRRRCSTRSSRSGSSGRSSARQRRIGAHRAGVSQGGRRPRTGPAGRQLALLVVVAGLVDRGRDPARTERPARRRGRSVANAISPWLLVAFLLGSRMPDRRWAAVAGVAALVLALVGYYAMIELRYGYGASTTLAGARWGIGRARRRPGLRHRRLDVAVRRGWRRAAAVGLLAAVAIAEGAYLFGSCRTPRSGRRSSSSGTRSRSYWGGRHASALGHMSRSCPPARSAT